VHVCRIGSTQRICQISSLQPGGFSAGRTTINQPDRCLYISKCVLSVKPVMNTRTCSSPKNYVIASETQRWGQTCCSGQKPLQRFLQGRLGSLSSESVVKCRAGNINIPFDSKNLIIREFLAFSISVRPLSPVFSRKPRKPRF